MPIHLALDSNYLSGTVHFENTKTAQVTFTNSAGNPVSFTQAPRITLTLLNASSAVPYKVNNIKTGNVYTGFVIGFQNPQTLDIEWQVVARI